jgi:hypothetical protein
MNLFLLEIKYHFSDTFRQINKKLIQIQIIYETIFCTTFKIIQIYDKMKYFYIKESKLILISQINKRNKAHFNF